MPGDRLDLAEPALRLDLRDHQRALVQRSDFRLDLAAAIIVLRDAEGGATPPLWRIVRRLDDAPRLANALHHRHHHAMRTDIERAGEKVVLAARHPDHGRDVDSATGCEQHLQRLEAEPGVLHVEQRELAGRGLQHLRHARREELEHQRAENGLAGQRARFERVRPHRAHARAHLWTDLRIRSSAKPSLASTGARSKISS